MDMVQSIFDKGMLYFPALLALVSSFVFAVLLTPRVAAIAERFDLLDHPSARKVHTLSIPRIGGVAIFIAFFIAIGSGFFFSSIRSSFWCKSEIFYVFVGGILAFSLGFYDDVKRLGPKTKFAIQIIAALFAYMGGIQIKKVGLPWAGFVSFDWLSLPITVFWILLVINAINLIDGLDGLAAGVSFFVSIVLLILCLFKGDMLNALVLAALAGSVLGFLVFNFNPASIFMGDSGSYFIGYMLATLSIYGSFKSQTAFTFLIPIIAMGVPLLDTVWATIRRFIRGQKLFYPDNDHFHHRLLKMGYSHKRAVVILYAITIFLGILALLTINVTNRYAAITLAFLAIFIVVFIQKLGYLNFLGLNAFLLWVNDVVNTLGINRDRRVFFSFQLAILESDSMTTFWERIVETAKYLGLDYIEMRLGGDESKFKKFNDYRWTLPDAIEDENDLYHSNRLYLRFPLKSKETHYGVLIISKKCLDMDKSQSQILWRLEFLRRTLSDALQQFAEKPQYGLQDRRRPFGDRRAHKAKEQLINEMEDRRARDQERRRRGVYDEAYQ